MNIDALKKMAAEAALRYIQPGMVVGVGTGSTTNFFIEALGAAQIHVDGYVASSIATENRLKAQGLNVLELNATGDIPVYIDGADEADPHFRLIKGGGGALTREKIVASAARLFVCIADDSKDRPMLGKFPLPVEVRRCMKAWVSAAPEAGFWPLRMRRSVTTWLCHGTPTLTRKPSCRSRSSRV